MPVPATDPSLLLRGPRDNSLGLIILLILSAWKRSVSEASISPGSSDSSNAEARHSQNWAGDRARRPGSGFNKYIYRESCPCHRRQYRHPSKNLGACE